MAATTEQLRNALVDDALAVIAEISQELHPVETRLWQRRHYADNYTDYQVVKAQRLELARLRRLVAALSPYAR